MEEKRISRLLRKSGFIPMLEEIYNKKDRDSKKVSKNLDKDKSDSTRDKIIMVTEKATPVQKRDHNNSSSASRKRVAQSPQNHLRKNPKSGTNENLSYIPSEDDQ